MELTSGDTRTWVSWKNYLSFANYLSFRWTWVLLQTLKKNPWVYVHLALASWFRHCDRILFFMSSICCFCSSLAFWASCPPCPPPWKWKTQPLVILGPFRSDDVARHRLQANAISSQRHKNVYLSPHFCHSLSSDSGQFFILHHGWTLALLSESERSWWRR